MLLNVELLLDVKLGPLWLVLGLLTISGRFLGLRCIAYFFLKWFVVNVVIKDV